MLRSSRRGCSRRFVDSDICTPHPKVINLQYIDPKGDKTVPIAGDTSIFLASDWIESLNKTEALRIEFESLFGVSKLEEFWATQDLSHPKFDGIRHFDDLKTKCIPLCIHGDGAEFQDRDSLLSISMTGLLKEGSTLETNLLLVFISCRDWCVQRGVHGCDTGRWLQVAGL